MKSDEKLKKFVFEGNDFPDEGTCSFFTINGEPILLTRRQGVYRAFSGKCPHHQAEFRKGGLIADDQIMCPWHHATFSLADGALINPPNLNGLVEFPVTFEKNELTVTIPERSDFGRAPAMAAFCPDRDARTFVIVGAGAAGNAAAESLRAGGFEGRIIMITRENALPYDRTLLSKEYLASPEIPAQLFPRSEEFYRTCGIELRFAAEITGIDFNRKRLFIGAEELAYDRLLLATGGIPRKLEIEGAALDNIFTLRSLDDARRIAAGAGGNGSAAIVGAGFIAMEVAAALRSRGLEVTVIAPEKIPFAALLGERIGKMIQTLHEKHGVSFRLGTAVAKFKGKRRLEAVVLADGTEVAAGLAIVGVGVRPATGFLPAPMLNRDGGVPVNARLELSGVRDVWAAGDIAAFPVAYPGNDVIRVEHWRVAEQHGRIAAAGMLDRPELPIPVPMFWTDQYDLSLNYTGYAGKWDEVVFDGSLEEDFIACYFRDGKLSAVAGKWRDREMCAVEKCFLRHTLPTAAQIRSGHFNWSEWLTTTGT